jgi:hypothetical protein
MLVVGINSCFLEIVGLNLYKKVCKTGKFLWSITMKILIVEDMNYVMCKIVAKGSINRFQIEFIRGYLMSHVINKLREQS